MRSPKGAGKSWAGREDTKMSCHWTERKLSRKEWQAPGLRMCVCAGQRWRDRQPSSCMQHEDGFMCPHHKRFPILSEHIRNGVQYLKPSDSWRDGSVGKGDCYQTKLTATILRGFPFSVSQVQSFLVCCYKLPHPWAIATLLFYFF